MASEKMVLTNFVVRIDLLEHSNDSLKGESPPSMNGTKTQQELSKMKCIVVIRLQLQIWEELKK